MVDGQHRTEGQATTVRQNLGTDQFHCFGAEPLGFLEILDHLNCCCQKEEIFTLLYLLTCLVSWGPTGAQQTFSVNSDILIQINTLKSLSLL